MYYHHLRLLVHLEPIHYIIDSDDYVVLTLPSGLELGRFPIRAGCTTEPHTFLETRTVGQFILPSVDPVTG